MSSLTFFDLNLEGELVSGWYQRIGNRIWLHVDGQTWQHEVVVPESRASGRCRSARGGSHTGDRDIMAPMPGKILQVNVKKGEVLKAGAVAVVMEAMKMEYSLSTHRMAEVMQVKCQPGDTVEIGQVLVELAEDDPEGV